MPEENHMPINGVPYGSEASGRLSESFGKEDDSASERNELFRKADDQRFGSLPNASERNTHPFPKASEPFRSNTPPASETLDEILSRPPRLPVHTLTAREVEKLFEQAGRPVTERSILNWCKPNSEGVCRLNCGYERGERRWYIAPESVERVIEEERKKDQAFPKESLEFSEASERLSESFGNERDFASESFGNVRKENGVSFGKLPNASERREPHRPSAPEVEAVTGPREADRRETEAARKKELDEMQKRINELEREAAAGQYKDELITTLRERLMEDRQDYNERMKFLQTQLEKLQTKAERYVEELVGINRRVGQLEAENRTLRMLPAGRNETPETHGDDRFVPVEPDGDAFGSAYANDAPHDQPSNSPQFHV